MQVKIPLFQEKNPHRKKVKQSSYFTFFLLMLLVASGCTSRPNVKPKATEDSASNKEIAQNLVFNNVTLEQTDEKGQRLWLVKGTQAIYSQDKKTAKIQKPDGDLYQDGKVIIHITADNGEVEEDGEKILLKGQLVATDKRNGAVLRGKELEWRPKEDLLIVRQEVTGTHEQWQIAAQEAKYLTRSQQMELTGKIIAAFKDPELQMRTEHLIWKITEQKAIADRFIQIDRFQNKQATAQVVSDRAEVNLKTKIANLKQNIQFTSVDPPLLMATNSATWDFVGQIVLSDLPVKIYHRQEKVTITANQGQLNLAQQVALFTGGVRGNGSRNQSQIYANWLKWEIPTQQFDAQGNVIYQQVNPPLNLTGSRAIGRMADQNVVVTSGDNGRVVTEIIP